MQEENHGPALTMSAHCAIAVRQRLLPPRDCPRTLGSVWEVVWHQLADKSLNTHTHTHTHTHTCTHTHTTKTRSHTRARALAHTHTHTQD